MRYAVKKVPPNVARDVRSISKGDKKLDHPYYMVEERKGTGKATCRQCDQVIDEGERTLYFHYAPEDDNVWIRTRGTIHADDCEGGKDEWTKCPKCMKQIPRADWSDHWKKEKGKRVGATDPMWAPCDACGGSGKLRGETCDGPCKGSGIMPYEDTLEAAFKSLGNEQCAECGLIVENDHSTCQGHQNCLPECPQCGGELQDIGGRKLSVVNPQHSIQRQRGIDDPLLDRDHPSFPGNAVSTGVRDTGDAMHSGQEPAITHPDPSSNGSSQKRQRSYGWGQATASESKVAARGTWDKRWGNLADKGLSREQALGVWQVFEDMMAHGTTAMANHSRAMLNKHFPPADDEWNVCSHCKGAGLLFTNPANPSQRPYRKCLDCAGMGKVAQRRPRVQQGLDPNTQPGNSTSMGESDQMGDMGDMVPGDNGWQPRVDPYTQDKIEKTQMEQLDQEARRLQRGMRGLDQFAGAWKSVSQVDLNEGEDYEDYYGFTGRGACDYGHFSPDVRRLPTGERSAVNVCQDHYAQEAEYRNMRQQMNPHADWSIESWDELEPSDDPEEMKVPIRRNAANERREEKKRQWAGESQAYELQKEQYESQVAEYGEQVKHYEGVTLPAWEQEQASKPPEKFQECSDCRGTGQGYGAGGTCRNCRGSGLEEKGPDRPPPPPRKPVAPTRPSSRPGTATGLRRNDRLDRRYRQKPTGKYYPNQTITCRTCSGSKEVENYKGEKEECYRCRGEGTEAHRDPRDLFEHHLENYSGKKDLVPIDPSTGVWEDVDQYHVRLHDTDILNYHKEKPYVSIDMGDDQPWVSYMRGRDGPRERMHYNEWDTMTTHDRLRRHLPNGISVGHEEVRTGKHPHERNEMVVKTPEASYLMRQGITINHETGLAVDPDTGKEDTTGKLFACKECHRYRETQEEMDKHQKRHDAYRKAYEKSPWRKCGDCNGQGTTAPWHTECKSCKGVGIDSENLPCEGCRGSGISYHKGADPKINWEYDPESGRRKVQITNPGACGTCGGSGKLEKGKPVEL